MVRFMPSTLDPEQLEAESFSQDLLLSLEDKDIESLLDYDAQLSELLTTIISAYESGGNYGLGVTAITNQLRRDLVNAARNAIYTQHPSRIAALRQLVSRQQITTQALISWQLEMLGVMDEYEAMGMGMPDTSWYDYEVELSMAYAQTLNRLSALVTAGAVAGLTMSELKKQVSDLFVSNKRNSFRTNISLTGRQAAALARRFVLRDTFTKHSDDLEGYMWLTVLDERVCNYCRPLHGRLFMLGDPTAPPLHRLCRCSMVPIPRVRSTGGAWSSFQSWITRRGLDFFGVFTR